MFIDSTTSSIRQSNPAESKIASLLPSLKEQGQKTQEYTNRHNEHSYRSQSPVLSDLERQSLEVKPTSKDLYCNICTLYSICK